MKTARTVLLTVLLWGSCTVKESLSWKSMEEAKIDIAWTDSNGVTARFRDHPSTVLPTRVAATDTGLRFEPADPTRGLDLSFSSRVRTVVRMQWSDVMVYGWWPLGERCAQEARIRLGSTEYCRVPLAQSRLVALGALDEQISLHQPLREVNEDEFLSSFLADGEDWSELAVGLREPPDYVEIAAEQTEGVKTSCALDGSRELTTIALARLAGALVVCSSDFAIENSGP